jgi:hypothetical protein
MLGAEALPRTEVIKHITSLLQDKNSRSNEILASHTYDYELQRQGCKEITIQEVPLCFEKKLHTRLWKSRNYETRYICRIFEPRQILDSGSYRMCPGANFS